MKGEYVEEKDSSNHNSMFAKLHQTQKLPHHQQQQAAPLIHPHPHHYFQQVVAAAAQECQTSEEADSRSSGRANTPTPDNKKEQPPPPPPNDGATIEVVRRPRGRPPGSKNKPKPPVIITRDSEPSMSPYILELPGGSDIVESISRFCRKRNTGICILTGSGTVANVTLRQPSATPDATVTFHGRFDILSISATILPVTMTSMVPSLAQGFTISLAGPHGQIVGGSVVGSLLAAGTVYIIAASFNNPSYHRLVAEEDVRNSGGSGGGNNNGEGQSPQTVSGGGDSGQAAESCGGMQMYSCHLTPSDNLWVPTARPPPPPPPY